MKTLYSRMIHIIACYLALYIYLQGFIPLKSQSHGYSQKFPFNTRSTKAISKLVIVVVDALRTDFITSNLQYWPHLQNALVSKEAMIYNTKVHPPTVTLPRIKAMMSGDVPGFVDVILNFDSQEFGGDNILYQLNSSGRKAIFYGDDTWLKLFPSVFLRHEGTTSFFVSDYTEVDNNVTRHIDRELENDDWSMMILHYLGLDHIGHLIGPSSKLIPAKLNEMDSVVEQIHESFKRQGLSRYLIVLCGDHGMADQGGHGGVTPNELSVPLVLISDLWKNVTAEQESTSEIYQIDLVPTLSSLLNLPIPVNSLGVIIPDVLINSVGHQKTLQAVVSNAEQLASLLTKDTSKESIVLMRHLETLHTQYKLVLTMASPAEDRLSKMIKDYINLCNRMRSILASKLVTYDVHAMIAGLALLALVMVNIKFGSSLSATYQSITILATVFAIATSLRQIYCTSMQPSPVLCASLISIPVTILGVILLCSVLLSFFHLNIFESFRDLSMAPFLITILPSILHSLSLLATSFIEEEHQIAYFFSVSMVGYVYVRLRSNGGDGIEPRWTVLMCLFLMSFARKWNQTGDKWAHLVDLADHLQNPDYAAAKVGLAVIALMASAVMSISPTPTLSIFIPASLSMLSTVFYVLYDTGCYSISYGGVIEANIVYACVLTVLVQSIYKLWRSWSKVAGLQLLRLSWVLLISLLHKTVNLPLMAVIIAIEKLTSRLLSSPIILANSDSFLLTISLYYWMALASYFYQGNSNKLSSVDISAGYKGMLSYNPIITGIFMFCNTFAGPVYWIASLIIFLASNLPKRFYKGLKELSSLYYFMKISDLTLLLFLIIIERYHLFVWTVFAPKLLYEFFHITLFSLIYLLFSI